MEYFADNLFIMNILQAVTTCKYLNKRNLLPKYPPGGRGRGQVNC
jgi:hypothetical protein